MLENLQFCRELDFVNVISGDFSMFLKQLVEEGASIWFFFRGESWGLKLAKPCGRREGNSDGNQEQVTVLDPLLKGAF